MRTPLSRSRVDAQVKTRRSGWRHDRLEPSMADVHRSIGPGPIYLVAVGYMDPGNWATSIAGGSKFGYTLLVVALVSNIMAIVLQSLCARLAIGSGRDLAQACRDAFRAWVAYPCCGFWPKSPSSPPTSPR
jgi:manganese transport protein